MVIFHCHVKLPEGNSDSWRHIVRTPKTDVDIHGHTMSLGNSFDSRVTVRVFCNFSESAQCCPRFPDTRNESKLG